MRHSHMLGRVMALVAAMCIGCVFTPGASAGTVILITGDTGNSTEGLGDFSGSMLYTFLGGDQGRLEVELTNTTNPLLGGYITGFVFNINSSDPSAAATLDMSFPPSHPFESTGPEDGAPFGMFDAGAALEGSFLGGGSPTSGIEPGDTGTFTFGVTASDAATLTTVDFVSFNGDVNFLVRFKGFENGGSDKVPAHATIIPLPGAAYLGLLGLGMVGGAAARRKLAARVS